MVCSVPARKSRAWLLLGLLWIAFAINYVDRQIVFSIFPVLSRELNFSNIQLGLTGTVFTWVYSLSMPLTGRIADVVRRDRLVAVSIVLWSLATLATGLSNSATSCLACRAAMGITEALFMPAALGLIATAHARSTRSRALATFATGQFAGIAMGGWYGGWAADAIGWRFGFYSVAALGVAYAAVVAAALRSHPAATDVQAATVASRPFDIIRSKIWLGLAAAFFTFCAMLWILLAWLATFVHERFGLSLAESGFIATVYLQAGSFIGTLIGGFLGDDVGRRVPGGRLWVGACGLLGSAPFAWAALDASSLDDVKLYSGMFGLLGGLFMANLYAGAYEVVSERNYGFAAGALNLLGGFAGGIAMLFTGAVKESFGIAFSIRCGAVTASAASIVLVAVVARWYNKDRASFAH